MTAAEFALGLIGLAIAFSGVMTVAWIFEQQTGNSGWIDTVWTFGLGGVGATAALVPFPSQPEISLRQWLVAAALALWSLRLGTHIAQRSARHGDDPRYAAIRAGWRQNLRWQMWVLAQKQAIVSIPMLAAVLLAAHRPAPGLRLQDVLGLALFVISIAGEMLADQQLREFRRNGRGAVCDIGLWRWSRHPNYFFEWLFWVGCAVIAIDFTGAYPLGWLALAAPACMYWLLVYVSGIPPLEAHMLRTRAAAFRAYQARTNAFFPWPTSRDTAA